MREGPIDRGDYHPAGRRTNVLELAEPWEQQPVDPAPGGRVVAREGKQGRTGIECRDPVLPPLPVEEVEQVVHVDGQLEGLPADGGERFRRPRVESPEPRVTAAVTLEEPAALPTQTWFTLDEPGKHV